MFITCSLKYTCIQKYIYIYIYIYYFAYVTLYNTNKILTHKKIKPLLLQFYLLVF
ncbi:MAG: hypothetical protein MCS20_02010 [Candidatus Phytoplasma mali]|nr:hypothetical protein [Candidatus Phytoplasma australiense]MCG7202165.1 hypothetical protein [Candidatus Phytoplasma mali]